MRIHLLTEKINFYLTFTDNYINRPSEDSSTAAFGEGSTEIGQILRIRRCSSDAPHVHICTNCTLACLYLVCHWKCRKTLLGSQDWLVGFFRRTTRKALQ